VTWKEVEKAAEDGHAANLTFEPDSILGRVKKYGDLFEPVLTLKQELL
jgi:bifunctional non-homologous end joining protein LigD